jgi:adenylate cyclase
VTGPTTRELETLGLYDPDAPHASERLELLEYLVDLGAGAEDLVAFREDLAGLPMVLAAHGGSPLTIAEVAERAGVREDKLLRLSRAAGFPQPGRSDRVFSPKFSDVATAMAAAEGMFGEEAVLQLVRVMGATMARLADALVSAFLVNVEPGISDDDPAGIEVARANASAGALLPALAPTLDVLLRQHILAARRSSLGAEAEAGYETRHMCVGFVDLVGSTALAQDKSTAELGAVLSEFEHLSADIVTGGGGRVVKLIGDEVLYTTAEERPVCAIALELIDAFADHPSIPPVRAGVASGDVMLRDGDVFGPVVNLAARAVGAAAASEVLAPPTLAASAGLACEPVEPKQLKGFEEPVELCRLLPSRLLPTGSGR